MFLEDVKFGKSPAADESETKTEDNEIKGRACFIESLESNVALVFKDDRIVARRRSDSSGGLSM